MILLRTQNIVLCGGYQTNFGYFGFVEFDVRKSSGFQIEKCIAVYALSIHVSTGSAMITGVIHDNEISLNRHKFSLLFCLHLDHFYMRCELLV